ncbi:MAG: ABC transporter permease [Desulfomicrobium escambiense]|nr:ABC transporter permease [Desulfomicrobium escambiense]
MLFSWLHAYALHLDEGRPDDFRHGAEPGRPGDRDLRRPLGHRRPPYRIQDHVQDDRGRRARRHPGDRRPVLQERERRFLHGDRHPASGVRLPLQDEDRPAPDGLRRSPHAADSLGVNIYKIRYGAVLTSGFLAGMGGFIFAASVGKSFEGTVSGFGFLAIAVLIFGNWRPFRVLFAAFFFGLMKTIAISYSAIPFLAALNINTNLYKMIPYVATLIVLVATSKSSHAPKAAGKIYDQGTR